MELVPYDPSLREGWDRLVDTARLSHFQFLRGYMDYHADRFADASYLVRAKGRWVAALPGHLWGSDGWASHRGLSYGGPILSAELGSQDVFQLLSALDRTLLRRGIRRTWWRPIPWIYHREPSEELPYFLFRQGAVLKSRNLSTVIEVAATRDYQRLRRRKVASAVASGFTCRETDDLDGFWPLVEGRLGSKYHLKPVHTLEEVRLLRGRLPGNIRLFGAYSGHHLVAGCLAYLGHPVFHLQYLHSSDEGRNLGAPDLLVDWMLAGPAKGFRWLHFGHSCEDGGKVLNEPLLFFKEGFGGRAVVLDEWESDTSQDPFPVGEA
ncbi:MAG TPA: GNAT family N-acetyltransferase [Fibrobacteria bacterium]|nr:GNAT family N-acetyltransferase [Fibrobacteria bacterium]HOX51373.1 GNAT family N-acetyltransferase [Fibrobacteria bacterium]